jgi:hypothetical protein
MKVAIVFENLEGGLSIAELKKQFDGTDEQIKAVLHCLVCDSAPLTLIQSQTYNLGSSGLSVGKNRVFIKQQRLFS